MRECETPDGIMGYNMLQTVQGSKRRKLFDIFYGEGNDVDEKILRIEIFYCKVNNEHHHGVDCLSILEAK